MAFALMLAVSYLAPPLAQDPLYHQFADQSHWSGIAHPMDVLSNLSFALFGFMGLRQIARMGYSHTPGASKPISLCCAQIFFVGLIATALGSGWYHLNPQDATLLWDRLGMAMAFVGLLSLLAATQVSERAAIWTLGLASVVSIVALGAWQFDANLLPWVVLQAGGLLLILGMGLLRSGAPHTRRVSIRWWCLVLAYGLAKVFELHDHQVADLLHGAFTGHAIKHLLASAAALPVLWGLQGLQVAGASTGSLDKRQRSNGSVNTNTATSRHT
jgi:hypothetical protein